MFEGSLVALVTPFDADDRIDYDALRELIEFHIAEGTDGLVIAGTTGESATLAKEEHVELVSRAAGIVAGRVPVIAGTGSNSTRQTIELSLAVSEAVTEADLAIDGYLMVAPYYNKPTQEGLYRHFHSIADVVDKPIMLYNVPGRTVTDILPETVARLAEHPNIVALKDATGDMARMERHRELLSPDFRYLSGDDFTVLDFIRRGGHGVVTVSGNVAPALMAGLCRAANSGDFATAEKLDGRLQPLNTAMFLESNPIPVKWALNRMGLIGPGIRLPLTILAEEYHAQVLQAMEKAGISRGMAA